jgi:hypothetical protein
MADLLRWDEKLNTYETVARFDDLSLAREVATLLNEWGSDD